ncbi:MAG: hypothetical protein ACM34K_00410 [Bacillota bacterium]
MKSHRLTLVFLSFLLVIFSISCSKEPYAPLSPKVSSGNEEKFAKAFSAVKVKASYERSIDTLELQTDSAKNPKTPDINNAIKTEWVFDHYEAIPGKVMGIWPRNARYNGERLKQLHYKWGFNYLLFCRQDNEFNLAAASGFPAENLLVQVLPNNYQANMDKYKNSIYGYYCDEPCENGYDFNAMSTYRSNIAPETKWITSSFRRISCTNSIVNSADYILFSSYVHWWQILPNVWVSYPVKPDQRPDWSDMKSRFGNKFQMTWIGAHMDASEYSNLTGHAANLGLKGLWLYQLEDATDDASDDNLSQYCYWAWRNGFLKRFERKYIIQSVSDDFTPVDQEKSGNKKGNIKATETGELREVIY